MFSGAGARCDHEKRNDSNDTNRHGNLCDFLKYATLVLGAKMQSLVRLARLYHRTFEPLARSGGKDERGGT